MSSGSHPPFPSTATSKPSLSSRPAPCNTRRIVTTFDVELPKACRSRMRMSTSLRPCSLSPPRHCKTPVHNATELLFAHPIWPFSEGSQFACLSDKHMQVHPGAKGKGVHLHENWACGTMKPPIREPAAVSLQPGRSDMSNIPTPVGHELIFPLAHRLRTLFTFP